jgi:hypothetical protein
VYRPFGAGGQLKKKGESWTEEHLVVSVLVRKNKNLTRLKQFKALKSLVKSFVHHVPQEVNSRRSFILDSFRLGPWESIHSQDLLRRVLTIWSDGCFF